MAETERSRIIFMGTPVFAATVLRRLLGWDRARIVGVFTAPDKKSGRGMRLVPGAVKRTALENGLQVYQPRTLRDGDVQELVRNLRADFIAVASYGLILPPEILAAPAVAPLNVHASLLPAYRGAAPIQRAIMENFGPDAQTGVSIMKMEAGLDTGPVYLEKKIAIAGKYHDELSEEMARTGGEALVETMAGLLAGTISPVPQNDALATYAHKLGKSDGIIDWSRDAVAVDALIRAVTPWPGAQTEIEIEGARIPVTILSGKISGSVEGAEAGQIRRDKFGIAIACGDRWYEVEKLRPQGRKEMSGAAFANGHCRVKSGICGRAVPSQ